MRVKLLSGLLSLVAATSAPAQELWFAPKLDSVAAPQTLWFDANSSIPQGDAQPQESQPQESQRQESQRQESQRQKSQAQAHQSSPAQADWLQFRGAPASDPGWPFGFLPSAVEAQPKTNPTGNYYAAAPGESAQLQPRGLPSVQSTVDSTNSTRNSAPTSDSESGFEWSLSSLAVDSPVDAAFPAVATPAVGSPIVGSAAGVDHRQAEPQSARVLNAGSVADAAAQAVVDVAGQRIPSIGEESLRFLGRGVQAAEFRLPDEPQSSDVTPPRLPIDSGSSLTIDASPSDRTQPGPSDDFNLADAIAAPPAEIRYAITDDTRVEPSLDGAQLDNCGGRQRAVGGNFSDRDSSTTEKPLLTAESMVGPLRDAQQLFGQLKLDEDLRQNATLTHTGPRADGFEFAWMPAPYTWISPAFYHKPLYFEQPNLERYGVGPKRILQPPLSAAHFFSSIPLVPYKTLTHHPRENVYTLGHCRPGNCTPVQRKVLFGQSTVGEVAMFWEDCSGY